MLCAPDEVAEEGLTETDPELESVWLLVTEKLHSEHLSAPGSCRRVGENFDGDENGMTRQSDQLLWAQWERNSSFAMTISAGISKYPDCKCEGIN